MDFAVFFFLFFTSMFLTMEAIANSSSVKCSDGVPDIHFHFRAKDQQLEHSGHPGFDLVCTDNTTRIHFPSYRDLIVKSISYNAKKLQLLDPKNCIHGVFLNLNLSLTPFRYYYIVKNYTYLNCSTRLPPYAEVACLSSSTHHVYTAESSLAVPGFCRAVKTVAIPFAYSPYLAGNSFGLSLTWDLPGCNDCSLQSKTGNKAQFEASSISFFVFIVITLVIISIKLSRKMEGQIYNDQQEFHKLLRDDSINNIN